MIPRIVLPRLAGTLLALAAPVLAASPQSTHPRPQPYALTNVRLSDAEDAPAKTILLRDGRIESIVDAALPVPPGVRIIDGEGRLALPAFIDAYTTAGCETPAPEVTQDKPVSTEANVLVDMREANRKGIAPSFRAVDVLALDEKLSGGLREQGFGVVLSSPSGQLLAGRSALATTCDAAMRDVVVRPEVFHHAAFRASGPGYPTTLMAYLAQLRQFFLDAQHHGVMEARFEAKQPGARPVYDADLDEGLSILNGERRLVCEAETARAIERWIKFADEFGLTIAISGGRDAWKVADTLAERDIPVFMTLDWGDEPKDPDAKEEKKGKRGKKGEEGAEPDAGEAPAATEEPAATGEPAATEEPASSEEVEEMEEVSWIYEEPIGIRRERRREWLEGRDCALRLREAGVRVLFCSGSGKPADLLKHVRTLVENGFPRDAALAALTSGPAEVLGVDRHFGWLKPGHSACIALWTKDPLEEGAKVACTVVDGFPYEFEVKADDAAGGKPAEGVDLAGTWTISTEDDEAAEPPVATLAMDEAGKLTGTLSFTSPMDEARRTEDVSGHVSGNDVSMEIEVTMGELTVTISFAGKFEDGAFSGDRTVKFPGGEQSGKFTATRSPDRSLEGGR